MQVGGNDSETGVPVVAKEGKAACLFLVKVCCILIRAMKPSNRYSLVLLLSYLLGSVLVEVAHDDKVNVLLRSCTSVERHDCGVNESHVVVESVRHCLACLHFAQRLATEVSKSLVGDSPHEFFGSPSSDSQQPLETDFHHSGKRGPPPSLSSTTV